MQSPHNISPAHISVNIRKAAPEGLGLKVLSDYDGEVLAKSVVLRNIPKGTSAIL